MALKFSVPYQGSKLGIAEEIFQVIHNREGEKKRYFYDLFGGGGAMSFLAQIKGYEVVYNELNEDIAQFIDFIINNKETCEYGTFPREFYNFVDKKTFNKIRDTKKTTPYKTFVLLTYSFGNNKQNYFCSADKEKYKREGHNLVVFLNYKDFLSYKERYQKQIQFLDGMYAKMQELESWRNRRQIFVNIILKLEAIKVAELENEYAKLNFEELYKMPNKSIVNKINELRPNIEKKIYKDKNGIKKNDKLQELKQLERLERLEQLKTNLANNNIKEISIFDLLK